MTVGIYRTIVDQVRAIWTERWTHPDVPVFWWANDADPIPDPSDTPHFVRLEVKFGQERIRAYGGGLGMNERVKYGSVMIWVFASRSVGGEDTALDLMSDAEMVFRSQRVGDLSFVGEVTSFDEDASVQVPGSSGNWWLRGSLVVFSYRFVG